MGTRARDGGETNRVVGVGVCGGVRDGNLRVGDEFRNCKIDWGVVVGGG